MNRVSVMGELAASLSHEITQPIASARNNARAAQNFLKMQPPDLGEVTEALSCVVGDADRAGEIIDRIREQIKKAPARKQRFDLNAAINEVIILARSVTNRNGLSVQTQLSAGLVPVLGDRVQLQQVLLNLILNAAEAMGSVEEGPRELLISTEQDPAGVVVAVRDSGPGINSAHLDRSSTPFTPRRPVEQAWGCRYAAPSSMLMGASCGRKRMSLVAPYFSSPCPAPTVNSHCCFRWVTGLQSCANALGELLFVNWLAQVAHGPVVQGASPVNIIRESGHENCRNRVTRVDEVSI